MTNEDILAVLHRAVGRGHGRTVADCISYRFEAVSGDVDMDWVVYGGFQRPMFQFEYRALNWAKALAAKNDPDILCLEEFLRASEVR